MLGSCALIFVTVGSVFPFDRLVAAADTWAQLHGVRPHAQIGRTRYQARSLETVESLPNSAYRAAVDSCQVVVAHAGMGSILTAAEFGKPIVVMPRRAALKEHNTDHQVDTANWMQNRQGVYVAMTECDLAHQIDAALEAREGAQIRQSADPALIARLRSRITFYARGGK